MQQQGFGRPPFPPQQPQQPPPQQGYAPRPQGSAPGQPRPGGPFPPQQQGFPQQRPPPQFQQQQQQFQQQQPPAGFAPRPGPPDGRPPFHPQQQQQQQQYAQQQQRPPQFSPPQNGARPHQFSPPQQRPGMPTGPRPMGSAGNLAQPPPQQYNQQQFNQQQQQRPPQHMQRPQQQMPPQPQMRPQAPLGVLTQQMAGMAVGAPNAGDPTSPLTSPGGTLKADAGRNTKRRVYPGMPSQADVTAPPQLGPPGQQQQPQQQQPSFPQQMPPQPQMQMAPPALLNAQNSQPQFIPGVPPPSFGASAAPAPGSVAPPIPGGRHPAAGGAAPGTPQPPKPRIDPNQIPSPVAVYEDDQKRFDEQQYFSTAQRAVPPMPSTECRVVDEGNCNPRYMRATMYNIPATDEMLQMSNIPLGLIVQPLATPGEFEAGVPVVDFGAEKGPIRCGRCKGYINPFCSFTQGGRTFVCNLCSFENETPPEYFCNLDMNGRRLDIEQRPELRLGSVEFVATKEYCQRETVPLSVLFAIDVSWNAIQSGMLALCIEALQFTLYGQSSRLPAGVKVGIMAYDKSLHFFNLKAGLDAAKLLVVPDINEPFVPLSEGFFVDPEESRTIIESLLTLIPRMFGQNKVSDAVLGSVLMVAHEAMMKTGGRVICFQTSLPTVGPGHLRNREDPKLLGTDKERTLYEPAEFFWTKMGQDCAKAGICIDIYLFPNSYIDVATIGAAASISGGATYNYTNFNKDKYGIQFVNDVCRNVRRTFGFEGIMRMRCSNGISVSSHVGNFYMQNSTDVEFGGIGSEKAIGVFFHNDAKLDEKGDSYFQCALLYTTATGERRIRVHNLSVQNTPLMGSVFRFADMDATLNLLSKQAISFTIDMSMRAVREKLLDRCVKILTAYRRHCASSTSPGQLILPESFKLFPIFTLALLKTRSFRPTDMSTDVRVHYMRRLKSMPLGQSVLYFYPRMYAVHELIDEESIQLGSFGQPRMPTPTRASADRIQPHGLYLLENAFTMFLYVGREASPLLLKDVFGVQALEHVDPKMSVLPEIDTSVSRNLHCLVTTVESQRANFMQLHIVRQGLDPLAESEFHGLLVEDKNHDMPNYVDFLCNVHRLIQTELNG